MSNNTKSSIYFYLSLLAALWFLLTCWVWTYLANVFISFPFGILAFFLWRKEKHQNRYKTIYWLLLLGVVISAVSLIVLMIFN